MAKSATPFRVFYSWQSDTAQNHCRYLVYEALMEAIEALNADARVHYLVDIDHDTRDEPGLCDIPAVILQKIDDADAIVSDLTYVAKTRPGKGKVAKACPNPNVLFEFGFAFRSLGHKRMVAVINEAHGPRSKTFFDLHHRRHPIPFKSPNPGSGDTRAKVIKSLAKELFEALLPIVQLGPRAITGDDVAQHATERAMIESHASTFDNSRRQYAGLSVAMFPRRYQERRWQNKAALQDTLTKRSIPDGMVKVPLRINEAHGATWGIFCHPAGLDWIRWAFTYAGQFWTQYLFDLGKKESKDIHVDRSRLKPEELAALPGVEYKALWQETVCMFDMLASLSREYLEDEAFEVVVTGEGFYGADLKTDNSTLGVLGPSESHGFNRRYQTKPSEFAKEWQTMAGDVIQDACDLFGHAGREMSRRQIDADIATSSHAKRSNAEDDT
jgi:hypothetical protein